MGVVFALAVAGRHRAEAQGAQRVADAGFQNAAVDLGHVAGERALVVEGVARHVLGAERALVHRHQVAADALADVVAAECAVLHKHIHLDAVAEGLVRDQARHLGRGDDLVLARLDPPGREQLARLGNGVPEFFFEFVEELRAAETGDARVAVLDLAVLAHHGDNDALGIDIALAEIAVGRQEELGDVRGLGVGQALEHVLVRGHAPIGNSRQLFDERLDVRRLGQRFGLLLDEERQRLVGQRAGRVGLHAERVKQRLLGGKLGADARGSLLDLCGVEVGECKFAVLAVFTEAHDHAALGGHGLARDAAGALRDAHREALRIGREHRDILIVAPQQLDQPLERGLDRTEIRRKWCFQWVSSCS